MIFSKEETARIKAQLLHGAIDQARDDTVRAIDFARACGVSEERIEELLRFAELEAERDADVAVALRDLLERIPAERRSTVFRIAGICRHCLEFPDVVNLEAMPCQCWNDE